MNTACLIIIGNEILSGRTQDRNVAWLAKELNEKGISLKEVRVVADDEAAIVEAVNACRARYSYVFTTGGIGPTHDDITAESIAKAFGAAYELHPEAERVLREYYKDQVNEARLKMAKMPRGAELIPNGVSIAPGFRMDNVYVMAGVPKIMQAMFIALRDRLEGGQKTLSKAVSAYTREGDLAAGLTAIQARHPNVDIGSYPFAEQNRLGVTLVARGADAALLEAVQAELRALMQRVGAQDISDTDRASTSPDDSWQPALRLPTKGPGKA